MKEVIHKHWDLEVDKIKRLSGYDNANFLIQTQRGKFIFKTYPFEQYQYELLKAETDILILLNNDDSNQFPSPVPTRDNEYVIIVLLEGRKSIVRMLSFLEGSFLAEVPHTPELFESLGKFLAKMDNRLSSVSNYVIQSRELIWDIQRIELSLDNIQAIPNLENRKLVQYFFNQYQSVVAPLNKNLRKSIIYNDANEWNVLVKENAVSAVIDFGDIAYSPLIHELAIGITYAIMGKEDPISWALPLLRGYHSIIPLERREIDLLYYLIAARLCISVCSSAKSRLSDPDNSYTSISEDAAWALLWKWIEINPEYARKVFLDALHMQLDEQPTVDKLIHRRHESISKIVSISYQNPIYFVKGAFQYMYDGYGNTFLDAYNNIPHVGHCHPRVVEAGQKQMAELNTNTRYLFDQLQEYAENLLSLFPNELNRVFFVNSGSAASDLAIRLARHYTQVKNVMVLEHGYHGHTSVGIEISDYKFNHKKGPGQQPYIIKAPLPDTYWGKYKGEDAGLLYAADAIAQLDQQEEALAAFIAEPIVGCGGQVPLALGYLSSLYPKIRERGGLCISDEVQTGFGRLGSHYWGFEMHGVIPDLVVLGKPMGNGHPMGAVVCTEKIARAFESGVEFFSSFGGNPVSCAIGIEVLNVIEEEALQTNALQVGSYYQSMMRELQKDFPAIADVRGSGLFLGFEMVDENGKPDTQLASRIKNSLRERNILISTDGPYDSVIKSKPPLCFSKNNAERVVENIREILIN